MEHKPLNLNASAIRTANSTSHFDAGDVLAREAQRVYADGMEAFEPKSGWTPEQRAYAARRADEWHALIERAYNDLLRRRASWVPVTVAGPSNYPAARMQKRADAEMKASVEWSGKMNRFLENTQKALDALVPVSTQVDQYRIGLCDAPISADDPAALEKLAARVEYLKGEQARMKALNAWYRKHKTCEGFDGLPDASAAKLDESIDAAYSWEAGALPRRGTEVCEANECRSPRREAGRAGWEKAPYPSYQLSLNNANIKRLEARMNGLRTARERLAQRGDAAETFDGLTLRRNGEENRVQLIFSEKPDADARALLKSRGFHWSPRAGAWQRQLTSEGLRAARAVVKELGLPPIAASAEQDAPEPVYPRLDDERRQGMTDAVKSMLQFMTDADLQARGTLSQGTLDALEAQGYVFDGGRLFRPETLSLEEFVARVARV